MFLYYYYLKKLYKINYVMNTIQNTIMLLLLISLFFLSLLLMLYKHMIMLCQTVWNIEKEMSWNVMI